MFLSCFVFLFSYTAKAQKKYNFRLSAHYVTDYWSDECHCSENQVPVRSNSCLGVDSVQVSIYIGTNLLKTFYSDTTGDFPRCGFPEEVYTMIFSKKGYITDTITADLIHLYNIRKASDGTVAWCHMYNIAFPFCYLILDNTFSLFAPMKIEIQKQKKGVRMIPKQ
jgi:hypothetical protein